MQEVKLTFVRKCLQEYATAVIDAMRKEIIRLDARDTDTLLKSLSYRVYQQSAEGNMDLSFAEWGRFVDMGVGKGQPIGSVKRTKRALKANKDKKRVPKKIYSPIVYGKLNGLMGDLAYGLTEEHISLIKKELESDAYTIEL